MSAIATYDDATTHDVTYLASWSSDNSSVAPITANGLMTGLNPGSANFLVSAVLPRVNTNFCEYNPSRGDYPYQTFQASSPVTVQPAILLNNASISSQQHGMILIGKQATLSLKPAEGKSIQSATWSVGGMTIGGVTLGQPPSSPNFAIVSPSFYWISAATAVNLSASGTYSDGRSFSASAIVDVSGPNVTITPTAGTDIYLINDLNKVGIGCGRSVAGDVCFSFSYSSAGPQGSFKWIQVIDNLVEHFTPEGGGPQVTCSPRELNPPAVSFPLLDSEDPYGTNTIATDSPRFAISSAQVVAGDTNQSYTMYLFWQPPDGIFVPIGSVAWSWNGSFALRASGFVLTGSGISSNPSVAYTTPFPTWSATFPTGEGLSCR